MHQHRELGRALRRDAAANQERVLAAAVSAILREGPQVPMATIAVEAGVGSPPCTGATPSVMRCWTR